MHVYNLIQCERTNHLKLEMSGLLCDDSVECAFDVIRFNLIDWTERSTTRTKVTSKEADFVYTDIQPLTQNTVKKNYESN